MRYLELPGEKTFLVYHTTGTGEQGGSPIEEKEFLTSFDSYEKALKYGRKRYPRVTGWEWDNFKVNVNLLTPEGKEHYGKFLMEFEALEKYANEHPEEFTTHKAEGFTIKIRRNPLFDRPNPITGGSYNPKTEES